MCAAKESPLAATPIYQLRLFWIIELEMESAPEQIKMAPCEETGVSKLLHRAFSKIIVE